MPYYHNIVVLTSRGGWEVESDKGGWGGEAPVPGGDKAENII